MDYDKLEHMAEQWDNAFLTAAELAMSDDHIEQSSYYIERAYQCAMIATTLHRIKGNA